MIKLSDLLKEQESFTATSKKSGETAVFKSKDARDSAVKAGTHSKIKDSEDGDSKKDTPKVNIFDKPKKDKKSEPKSEPSKFDIADRDWDWTGDIDNIMDKISNAPKSIKQKIQKIFSEPKKDEPKSSEPSSKELTKKSEPKSDSSEKAPRDEKNRIIVPKELGLKGDRFNDDWYQKTFAWVTNKEQQKVVNDLIKKSSPGVVDKLATRGLSGSQIRDGEHSKSFQDSIQKILDKRGGSYNPEDEKSSDEPSKDSANSRPGNPQVNKVVRNKAKSLGVTPQKLGKEEYEKRMSQAAVEALTDANFHSESRALIAVLEDNPELAKNPSDDPNKPDMFSDEYDEWKKGTAWGSSFGDSSDGTDDIAHSATGESSWDGQESIDAIAFDLKMNGSHKLAAKIQSIFDEKNESSTSIADMIPESTQINEGTRSQVGVIGRNGKIISAYVHYDGYPSNMKPGLKKHMKSDKDVLKLIKMGGARGIFDDKEIEYYKSGQPMKGDSKDIAGYIKDADMKTSAEYVYLYNIKDKKWYYADTYKDTELKKLF